MKGRGIDLRDSNGHSLPRLAKGYGPAMKVFQPFRLDTVNHCLWRAEERVRLTPRAFGDDPEKPAYIETFPRRGYQFIAPVSDESAAPFPGSDTKRIVGRKTALAELDVCLASALRGQRQAIFVTGEAGIGKTALVDVFQQQATRRPNLRLARGQCIEGFGGKEAYYPILEALGSLVLSAEDGSLVQMLAKHAPTWLIQFSAL